MDTGENQTVLNTLLHQQINTAVQVLLNQGQTVINALPMVLDKKMADVFQILHQTNSKIQSLEYLENAPERLDCPLYFGDDQTAVMFDWTLSYLCIDAACGGINGLSIEKRRFDMYSALEKKLLGLVLKKMADVLDIKAGEILDKQPHQKFYYFRLKTPQTTGILGMAFPTEKPAQSPALTGDNITLPLQATLTKMTLPLTEVLKWKKGTYLSLSEQNKELNLTWVCQDVPLAVGTTPFLMAEVPHDD